ncbi:hypothetical protein C1854_14455, partial [Eggerthella lenta]|uniref:ATP-binding protein n=1 Tax=Eggerthella lenta TaxID=84112 RepID=UPI000E11A22F
CSQFSPAGWHAKLGEGAIADAVIDRIVYRSDVIHIEGDESMRDYCSAFATPFHAPLLQRSMADCHTLTI